MNASEIALKLASERKAKAAAEKKAAEEATNHHEKEKVKFERHVKQTLASFKKLGFKVKDGGLFKDSKLIVTVKIEWQTWSVQYSDDTPEVERSGYRFVWKFPNKTWLSGDSGDIENFEKYFGQAMAEYV